jgi:hypothetical protein
MTHKEKQQPLYIHIVGGKKGISMEFRNNLNKVGQTFKKAGTTTGNGIVTGAKATASECIHAVQLIKQKVADYKEYREMLAELNDVAGDFAKEISKYNSRLEILDAAKAFERHALLLHKVLKEMDND